MSIITLTRGTDMENIRNANRLQPLDSKSLWMENDLCIFFGPTGIGKSIFAVQTAIDVTRKTKKPVLYYDLELSESEFMQRFSSDYLGELFYRAAPDTQELLSLNAKKITTLIRKVHNEQKIKYFIVDNISIILDDATNYDKAKRFILEFKSIVDEMPDVSIMLIGHTPKRDNSCPVTADSLAGSKALLNFTKSAFAIMPSVTGKNIAYVKQLKTRNSELFYDDKNVLVYKREKKNNILLFSNIGTADESDHLFSERNKSSMQNKERNKLIHKLKKEGKSLQEIVDYFVQRGHNITREGVRYVLSQQQKE